MNTSLLLLLYLFRLLSYPYLPFTAPLPTQLPRIIPPVRSPSVPRLNKDDTVDKVDQVDQVSRLLLRLHVMAPVGNSILDRLKSLYSGHQSVCLPLNPDKTNSLQMSRRCRYTRSRFSL